MSQADSLAAWTDTTVTPNALTYQICELREALRDDSHHPRYIKTIPRVGYKFIADVVVTSANQGGKIGAAPSESPRPSVAVLPFRDMSPKKDQDYLYEGVAGEIINTLAHLERLRVVARTSSFSFKGREGDIRQIGKQLNKELLELCGRAYPIIKQKLPDLQMTLVCGPRLPPESLETPEGPEMRGYVPALYEHFAASDLTIVQAGGTSTLELTALRRPFLYFPLEDHFEQQVHVAARLQRHGAGIGMQYPQTTPESLAAAALSNLGKEVDYPPIRTDGAKTAALMINRFLQSRNQPS